MHDLMTNAPCGFVAFADDGTIVELNQTLADLLGYSRIELLGWHVDKILPPGARIFYHTYLFPMLKVQELVEEIFIALRTRDGKDVPMLLNGARRERDGRMVSDCVCLRMIQRHEYEAQLLQARRLAEESSAAKAKFLSMMSHDLRTPLTAIYGNAQMLACGDHGPLTADQQEAVEAIRDACTMQMNLISDILEFARLESGRVDVRPGPVRASEIVARAASLIRVQVSEAGLRLITRSCEETDSVMADPHLLQQILLNLLTNAVKFTPAGGEITVSCESRDGRFYFHVRDTGIGIDEADLERIFSPFVQVQAVPSAAADAARGVGLGLAISRDLARAMQGDVTASSSETGSTFTIDLPAAPPSETIADEPAAREPATK
jgi:PAS domain S-box-containing protein